MRFGHPKVFELSHCFCCDLTSSPKCTKVLLYMLGNGCIVADILSIRRARGDSERAVEGKSSVAIRGELLLRYKIRYIQPSGFKQTTNGYLKPTINLFMLLYR